ncbi:MAG: hypothetical protein U0Z53_16610 [Blastocatellia bacterium]
MKLSIADLTTDRQWCAATGFTAAQFAHLLSLFTRSYFELYGQTVAQRQTELAITPTLTSEEELLFFTLFSLKAGLTYDLSGFVSGMDASNAKRNQQLGLDVLHHTLAAAQCLPRREFTDAAEFRRYLQNETAIIIDGLEQRIQRPADDEAQRDFYSGKKSVTPSKP